MELELLNKVMEAAEKLSTAMVESESKGADYSLVDNQWINLTASIQAVYEFQKKYKVIGKYTSGRDAYDRTGD